MSDFTFGSVFSGIGLLDLGLIQSGMKCLWQIEKNEFRQKLLKQNFPNIRRYKDVRDVYSKKLAKCDLICGGFPCQNLSLSGNREGLSGKESVLWYEYARIIRDLKPRWVLVENVIGLLSSNSGGDFGEILRFFSESGYDVEWNVLSAEMFGAPHLRERVFIIAYSKETGLSKCRIEQGKNREKAENVETFWTDPRFTRLYSLYNPRKDHHWSIEPRLDRLVDGSTRWFYPNRRERIEALGDAVIPQSTEWIGRRILEIERMYDGTSKTAV